MTARVSTSTSAGWTAIAHGVERSLVVPPERGSELALDSLRLAPGAALDLDDPLHDTLLFAHGGDGDFAGAQIAGPGGAVLAAGAGASLQAGTAGLELVRATIGAATDLHAPMGATEPVVTLSAVGAGAATGSRSFRILHGPHNGSVRATTFVGAIPPGKAP